MSALKRKRGQSKSAYVRALARKHPSWTLAELAEAARVHRETAKTALTRKSDKRGRPPVKKPTKRARVKAAKR